MTKISISKEYGLNPSVETCFVCGKDISVVLFGTGYKGADGKPSRAPHSVCLGNLCDECKKLLDSGYVFLIEVTDGSVGANPYRTGRTMAIKESAIKNIFSNYSKINYIEKSAWDKIFPKVEEV